MSKFSITDFHKKFPNEDACLDYLFKLFYGDLEDFHKYYKVKGRKTYAHSETGKQISPTAGTIFHKSSTPLMKWFYVIFLFSCSRNGVSSYEIERQIGVTHKTAWRMGKQIRQLFSKTGFDKKLSGVVEADETYVGGKKPGKRGRGAEGKTSVVGMVEREGDVVAQVTTDTKSSTIMPLLRENIEIGSVVMTDEYRSYNSVSRQGFDHQVVNHGIGQYVDGDRHTNTLEGFWSQMKRAIDGTHHFVSPKYLQTYVNEFTWKYNLAKSPIHLFEVMIVELK